MTHDVNMTAEQKRILHSGGNDPVDGREYPGVTLMGHPAWQWHGVITGFDGADYVVHWKACTAGAGLYDAGELDLAEPATW